MSDATLPSVEEATNAANLPGGAAADTVANNPAAVDPGNDPGNATTAGPQAGSDQLAFRWSRIELAQAVNRSLDAQRSSHLPPVGVRINQGAGEAQCCSWPR